MKVITCNFHKNISYFKELLIYNFFQCVVSPKSLINMLSTSPGSTVDVYEINAPFCNKQSYFD